MSSPTSSELSFISGATGFIGSHLARRLCSQGRKVRALVRPNSKFDWMAELDIETVSGDLRDTECMTEALKDVSYVFHCGGLVSDWGSRSDFHGVNVLGTRNILKAAAEEKVSSFVHLSSASVYGYPKSSKITEQAPLRSRRIPYIESKIQAEHEVWETVQKFGLRASILRPVMVFGPGCQNYVGEVVRHLLAGSMLLLDEGRHLAGLAYVENVVDAILAAANTPEAQNQVMNVCDDLPVTWKEYIDTLADGVGAPRVKFSLPTRVAYPISMTMEAVAKAGRRRKRPLLTRLAVLELGQSQEYDISLARRTLGYTPRVSFEDAMTATLKWINKSL